MKTAIVMPTYNRPEYLSVVLDALRKCYRLNECFIVTSEEPVNCGIGKLFDDFKEVEIIRNVNQEKLGCNKNIGKAIGLGFECSDRIIFLEDDIVPSRDFLIYMLNCLDRYKDDKNILGISSYQLLKEEKPISQLSEVLRLNDFGVWGWATWKDRWEEIIKPNFERIFNSGSAISWDHNFNQILTKDLDFKFIHPLIGRTQNIGEHGTYVPSAEWQRENQFTPVNSDSYNLITDKFIEVLP